MLSRRNFFLSKMEEHRKRSAFQEDNKSNLVGTKRISEPESSMQEDLDDFNKPLAETKIEPTSDTVDSAVGEITPGLEGAEQFRPGTMMVCRSSDPTQPYFPWDTFGNLKTAVGHQPNQNFDQK